MTLEEAMLGRYILTVVKSPCICLCTPVPEAFGGDWKHKTTRESTQSEQVGKVQFITISTCLHDLRISPRNGRNIGLQSHVHFPAYSISAFASSNEGCANPPAHYKFPIEQLN